MCSRSINEMVYLGFFTKWFRLSLSLFSRSDMKFQVQTLASLKKRYYESIFAHAEFDNEVIEVVLLGELQQILPRLLPQTQVNRVGVEPHLHYISLLLRLDVTR